MRGEEKGIALATMKFLAGSACGLLFFFFPLDADAIPKILDVRHWSAPDHTRIVFDLSAPASYKVFATSDSQTLSWCIENTIFPAREKIVRINDLVVKSVSLQSFSYHRVRVTVMLAQPVQAKVFTLAARESHSGEREKIHFHSNCTRGRYKHQGKRPWSFESPFFAIISLESSLKL